MMRLPLKALSLKSLLLNFLSLNSLSLKNAGKDFVADIATGGDVILRRQLCANVCFRQSDS